MKWILCIQTNNDRVRFQTSEVETFLSKTYYDFLKYVQEEIRLPDFNGFRSALDAFKPILIHADERKWEIYRQAVEATVTTKDLYELNNEEKQQKKEDDKNPFIKKVKGSKALIDVIEKRKPLDIYGISRVSGTSKNRAGVRTPRIGR